MIQTKRILTDIYVRHTNKEFEELTHAMDRDNYMTAVEAKEYGLVDQVVESRKAKKD